MRGKGTYFTHVQNMKNRYFNNSTEAVALQLNSFNNGVSLPSCVKIL